MLEYLKLENVGPAAELEMQLGSRLNIITGDNGLGKSFLLDVAWWALTRRWPADVNPKVTSALAARPFQKGPAAIEFSFHGKSKRERYRSTYERRDEAWTGRPGRPANPGLVLYAQVDGGFAVWDPARNYWRKTKTADIQERLTAYVFSAREVWNGLKVDETQQCLGLLADWALWQKENGEAFAQLCSVLEALSPSRDELLVPGALGKLSVGDARWIPSLRMPYGIDVLLPMASAAVQRIVALAYLLVWSWQEHVRAAALLEEPPTGQVTFLIDEIECHLHPRWQRTIVRALLEVMGGLAGDASVQVIAATHSPLLLASLEPVFDPQRDAWFDLDLDTQAEPPRVDLSQRPYVRHGDVSNWLTSEAFDLTSARSIEAEELLEQASIALADDDFDAEKARELDVELRNVLGDTDPFWMRGDSSERSEVGWNDPGQAAKRTRQLRQAGSTARPPLARQEEQPAQGSSSTGHEDQALLAA